MQQDPAAEARAEEEEVLISNGSGKHPSESDEMGCQPGDLLMASSPPSG